MRTRAARARAEEALAGLAVALGSRRDAITVIGGLNADLLTEPTDPPHQGTVDVDVLVQVGLVYDRDETDLGWLERALVDAGFGLGPTSVGWRWWRDVEGMPVKVELLCDVFDHPGQEIALPGCATASAQNLRGPAAALGDAVVRQLRVEDGRARGEVVEVRFAGLGGYLLAKAGAAFNRHLDKDFYDLAFVLLHNRAGDPRAAARAARSAVPPAGWTDYPRIVMALRREFGDADARGARAYATQRVRDGAQDDAAALAEDAVEAVRLFVQEFAGREA